MNEYRIHECNEKCTCPIHKKLMFYSTREKLHACPEPDCVFAHGYENAKWADPNHNVLQDILNQLRKSKEALWTSER